MGDSNVTGIHTAIAVSHDARISGNRAWPTPDESGGGPGWVRGGQALDHGVQVFAGPHPGVIWTAMRQRRDAGAMVWRRSFPGRGDQVSPARKMVRLLLEDTARADDAEWVAAELISNALLHSRSGEQGGHFLVEVARYANTALVQVYDLGGHGVPHFDIPPHQEGGRGSARGHGYGLRGVATLAATVGHRGDPLSGHAVWAQLVLSS